MITVELCAADILCCRKVYFHLRRTQTNHRDNRHPCPYRFMFIKQMLLYESVKRSIETRIFQLVFVMLILSCYLLQSIHSLVIGIGCSAIVLIKGHHTFSLSFDLQILGFSRFQLYPIISRVKLCQQLAFPHPGSVFHTYFAYRSAYPKR